MRAIYINAVERTVKEIEVKDVAALRKWLGCELLQPMNIGNENDLWCDEEGLLKQPQHFFMIEGYDAPLAMGAIILGRSPRSNAASSTTLSVEGIQERIAFLNRGQAENMAKRYDRAMQMLADEQGAIFMPISDLFTPIE